MVKRVALHGHGTTLRDKRFIQLMIHSIRMEQPSILEELHIHMRERV